MSEAGLIQQQREILRAHRQAVAQFAQTELEAQSLLNTARDSFEQVKNLLASKGEQVLLPATHPFPLSLPPGVDVYPQLAQSVEKVLRLADVVKTMFDSLPSNWAVVGTWQGHKKPLLGGPSISLAFSPDGEYLYSSGPDSILRIWEVRTKKVIQSFRFTKAEQIALTPDGRLLIAKQTTIWLESTILVYDAQTLSLLRTLKNTFEGGETWAIYCISKPVQHKIVATSCVRAVFKEGRKCLQEGILVWQLDSGQLWWWELGKPSLSPVAAAIHSSGKLLSAAWADGNIKIFLGNEQLLTFQSGSLSSCDLSPDGRLMVSAETNGTVRLWDLEKAVELQKYPLREKVCKVVFSPDGKLFAAAVKDKTVRVWSAQDGRQLTAIDVSPIGAPNDLAFAPDGRLLAVSGEEKILLVKGEWPELVSNIDDLTQAMTEVEHLYERLLEEISTKHRQLADAEVMGRLKSWLADFEAAIKPSAADWAHKVWETWIPSLEEISLIPLYIGLHRVPFQGDQPLSLPALLSFPSGQSLLFMATREAQVVAAQAIQSLLLRLLASLPPGKLRFTFIDPVGLGQNVAPLMALADHDEQLVTARAWSDPRHIEQRLAELSEHIETVIQKYLRHEYATIEEYNEKAGEIAEPYRFLVVFDFPANFTEETARRLASIVQNGPRCGVYTLILMDPDRPLPYGFNIADLERPCTVIAWKDGRWVWEDEDFRDGTLELDGPPPMELFNRIIAAVGERAKEATKVEVPFERIIPPREQWWQERSLAGLSVPLGPAGARRVQSLTLGSGTSQHALVVGKTGSGKSTLLHVLITNLALRYSPDEVQVYLVDFKKGVEFKPYATYNLPHARVVAIESEREFGLSVLQGLDAELKRRGDLFRAAGVDHIADYRTKALTTTPRPEGHPPSPLPSLGEERGGRGEEVRALPRILLIVDEFQEFFTEDDPIASQAAQVLDRLVRQGRAFGIHVLLGSQTLSGAYTLARSTVDQMAVRIALQCSEADSRLILADDNPAARLLSRPGEAIYNDANGLVEGNSRFQVAWLPDEQRDRYLVQVQELSQKNNYRPPRPQIVFEGNAPADVEKNRLLYDLLTAPLSYVTGEGPGVRTPRRVTAWLGEPIAIADPTAAYFRRQSGSNLLIVGQNDEAALGMMAVALVSLVAQQAPQDAAFYVLDFGAVDAPYAGLWENLAGLLPHPVKVGRRRQLPDLIGELATEVQSRLDNEQPGAPSRYLFLYGLQRARDLRQEEVGFGGFGEEPAAPTPAQQFTTILREGPDLGIHTVVWCDTVTNLNRSLDRRALREFAMRVVFQMSAEDSANLIDSPLASKLGPYRALFYDEEEGRLEKFRPYGLPSAEWLEYVKRWLAGKQ